MLFQVCFFGILSKVFYILHVKFQLLLFSFEGLSQEHGEKEEDSLDYVEWKLHFHHDYFVAIIQILYDHLQRRNLIKIQPLTFMDSLEKLFPVIRIYYPVDSEKLNIYGVAFVLLVEFALKHFFREEIVVYIGSPRSSNRNKIICHGLTYPKNILVGKLLGLIGQTCKVVKE